VLATSARVSNGGTQRWPALSPALSTFCCQFLLRCQSGGCCILIHHSQVDDSASRSRSLTVLPKFLICLLALWKRHCEYRDYSSKVNEYVAPTDLTLAIGVCLTVSGFFKYCGKCNSIMGSASSRVPFHCMKHSDSSRVDSTYVKLFNDIDMYFFF
jgi:hypothetical protein